MDSTEYVQSEPMYIKNVIKWIKVEKIKKNDEKHIKNQNK